MKLSPVLLIVSAPSGAGKTTLCDRLLAEFPTLAYSVSCTTRAPRVGEVDGEDYHFLSDAEFRRRLAAGDLLEHATVHGHLYGTPRSLVERSLDSGRDVLMDIDVQGAAQIRETARRAAPDDPVRRGYADVFIAPPSLAALRQRLEGRGTDARDVIERRLRKAEAEMARSGEYMHVVVNDVLDEAYARLRAVFLTVRARPDSAP
ncbi:MAG: guanylate kinase [Verrucomicrobia bacterium A1]|nr:MAG: guanylate kinase [Verrucomicrobia bacterium A1]